jgi:hypothetical protein
MWILRLRSIVMTKNKRLQVQSHVVFIMNEHLYPNLILKSAKNLAQLTTYSKAQTENTKSMSYQGLSQRGINERSVCIRGRSAKQATGTGL